MSSSEAGKGDAYRPVDRGRYDINMLLLYGVICPKCGGPLQDCRLCHGVGFVEKWVARRFTTWGDAIL